MLSTTGVIGAAAIVALASGALLFSAGQSPSPMPTAVPASTPTLAPATVADEFMWPFEYTLPAGSQLVPTRALTEMYGFTEGSSDAYPDLGATQVRGVTVTLGTPALTHTDRRGDDLALRPEAFLADLRGNPTVSVGSITATVLGGLPALQADVEEDKEGPGYAHMIMDGDWMVELAFPGRLIVADVDGASLVVHIWAGTPEELAAWLPMATDFVDSIRFTRGHPARDYRVHRSAPWCQALRTRPWRLVCHQMSGSATAATSAAV